MIAAHRLWLFAVALVLALPSLAAAAGQTARFALPQVMAAAKKWQGDAVLVSLSSTKARIDGTAPEWKYSFYSPASQKRCFVTARGTQAEAREVRLGYDTAPLGEFVDSDQAAQEAQKHGIKGELSSMAVKHWGSGKAADVFWIVNGATGKGGATVFIVARTGQFSSRVAQE
jgi:hypothetical protein